MAWRIPNPLALGQATREALLDLERYLSKAAANPTGITEAEADDRYVNETGDVMTGPLGFRTDLATGAIGVVPDPGTPGGYALEIASNDGVIVRGPYHVLDTQNPVMTMTGAQLHSPLIAAGFDSLGGAILGWGAPMEFGYEVQDSTDVPVVIKNSGDPIDPTWVPLGLSVTLGVDVDLYAATVTFQAPFLNSTNRTGVVELGASVNGAAVVSRNVTLQIAANYNQTLAIGVVNQAPYVTGDVVAVMARVISNSNNQFGVTMNASPGDPAFVRVTVAGAAIDVPARPWTWNDLLGVTP